MKQTYIKGAKHIVGITATRYFFVCSVEGSMKDALQVMNDLWRGSYSLVIRDGATGRRYSRHEARMAAAVS